MAYDWALVAIGGGKPPQAWNLYHTEAEALENQRKGILEFGQGRPYAVVMPTQDYITAKHEWHLSREQNALKPCTPEAWMEALECLPPLKWHRENGVERFLMSEFYSGSLTHQYARIGDLCGCRLVDATDRTTWITRDELLALRHFDPAKVSIVRKRFSVTQGEVEVSYDGKRIEQYGDTIAMHDTPEPGAQNIAGWSGRGDAYWIEVARRFATANATQG